MPVLVGRMCLVADVIKQATSQGCDIRISQSEIVTPWGTKHVRFLYNPHNRGRFDLTDYNDDEFMLESELANCERRLGITLA